MKLKKKFNIVVIADIHIGAMDAKVLFAELKSEFIDKIKNMDKVDLIVILGDTLDHKLFLNSSHSKIFFIFIKLLCDIANEKDAAVRIIKGTEFHDNDQLENLNSYKELCDLKIIPSVSREIIDGLNVLYIPEEYMDNQDEYYHEYFEDEYDFIFGHGMVEEAAFVAHNQESEITMKKCPIFKTSKLLEIVRGGIFFGHIHTHTRIKKRFYYVGSFSRWAFGEEDKKGWMTIEYDKELGDMKTKFIENELVRSFDTIKLTLSEGQTEAIINGIREIIKNNLRDRLRLKIIISESVENPQSLTNVLNEVFGKIPNLKIEISSSIKEIKKKAQNEKIERLLDEYGFIFDKGMAIEEKVVKFIEKKYNKNISVEKMKKYLYEKLFG